MPIYEYDCPEHGTFEVVRRLADRQDKEPCPGCGGVSDFHYSLPAMQPDRYWSGYYNRGLDEYITSKRQERDIMERSGLERAEPGWKEDAARHKKEIEAREDAARTQIVEQTYGELKSAGLIKS